jgi:hypothetical protein
METSELERLVRLNFSVIPGHSVNDLGFCSCRNDECSSPGKHPRIAWAAYQDRRPTSIEVKQWWTRWPDANPLIITGAVSNVVVLDIDPRHGGDESLKDLYNRSIIDSKSSETPISLTGGGGQHLFFAHPSYEISNATGVWPGIDFRGDHGYVVGPSSTHISGRTYEWDVMAHPDDKDFQPLPPLVEEALRSQVRYGPGFDSNGEPVKRDRLDIDAIISGRVTISEGERNETMLRLVGSLIGPESVEAQVLDSALTVNDRSFDPPLDEGEVTRLVGNVMARERRKNAAATETLNLMTDPRGQVNTNDLSPNDLIERASALWQEAGVGTVTDWFIMRGGDRVQYLLLTPESEVELGNDLLDYRGLRRTLLSQAGVLMPWEKIPSDWSRRALLLHLLAREEVIAPTRASERVDEWVSLFYAYAQPRELDEITHRRDYLQSQAIIVNGEVWLKPSNLLRIAQREDDTIKSITLTRMLKRAGWSKGSLADGDGGVISAWHKPWISE